MALNILPPPVDRFRLDPVESRHAPIFCFALLTISCALASFAIACATPFAAFSVVAAATLPLRPALLVASGAWLVNQTIGFGALHYPIDASTIAWGFVIGAMAGGRGTHEHAPRRRARCDRGFRCRSPGLADEPHTADVGSHPDLRLCRL